MALRSGYSWETVHANIAQMREEGYAESVSVAAAFADARKAFFKRYPDGALPAWLTYPKGYRLARHYNTRSGEPHAPGVVSTPRPNPSPAGHQLRRAARLFEDFSGRKASKVEKVRLAPLPKAGLAFGSMTAIEYESMRDGKLYRHSFRPVKSRPLLVATFDGKRVILLGGAYTFTERGIENDPS